MNRKERNEVVRRALKDAFAPRFAEIENELNETLKQKLQQEHPTFVRLMSDPEAAEYVMATTYTNFRQPLDTNSPVRRMTKPEFNSLSESELTFASLRVSTLVPSCSDFKVYASKETSAKYDKVWEDYLEAKRTLLATVGAYTTRERLAKDFPHLAVYLPEPKSKPKLPAVLVEEVAAKLQELGVPPQGEVK